MAVTAHMLTPCVCVSVLICRCLLFPLVSAGPVIQFKLSDIGEGIMEVTVKEW